MSTGAGLQRSARGSYTNLNAIFICSQHTTIVYHCQVYPLSFRIGHANLVHTAIETEYPDAVLAPNNPACDAPPFRLIPKDVITGRDGFPCTYCGWAFWAYPSFKEFGLG